MVVDGGAAGPAAAGIRESALPWAVVGAGVHGMTAVKALLQLGVAAQGFERSADVGGIWSSAAPAARCYDSLHMVSSRAFTQFPDFPMPANGPDYPSRQQAHDYLRRYAAHFGLYDHVRFGSEVLAVEPVGAAVDVTVRDLLTDGIATSRFAGVVLANGHHNEPIMPNPPGLAGYSGEVLHAADYRSPEQLRGRRVLVVGGGNSGCDIAVDAGLAADTALHSTRGGVGLRPRYALGRPVDQLGDLLQALRVPAGLRRLVLDGLSWIVLGDAARQHPDGDRPTRPAVNQVLPLLVGLGRVQPKPEIERFLEDVVVFADGSTAEVDVVIFATGYRRSFPFASAALPDPAAPAPLLHRAVFSPDHPGVAVAGLIDSDTGQWGVAHWQGMLIAHYARARRDRPQDAARYADHIGQDPGICSPTVAHQPYLRQVEQDIRTLEGSR